ncbi:hypothetical protein HU200_065717 [Digitaria exilis]|uniref:F-box domain-containing protein n=1 Tax=Digitaria exilis TaxID=1010633 RepID=A0A835A2C7_9POAL|nr:hypothetical protein HU200_065717 [Digitaria exilis]
MGDRWDRIPADILMEILRRLPPSPRQHLRLICRHWRSAIDDRSPAKQARAVVLTFVTWRGRHRAYVLDDLTKHGAGSGRELKLPRGAVGPGVSMVSTCNGLLCLRRCWDGDFLVVNPVTGETLAVPPPSESSPGASMELALDSFAYHPETGQYKIVRVPSSGAVKGVHARGHVVAGRAGARRDDEPPP